uniref:Uncharacterized protein n=1 Tax=Arundo donax TaxID=35708 RepID=A0A0A9HBH4_ARUDO
MRCLCFVNLKVKFFQISKVPRDEHLSKLNHFC